MKSLISIIVPVYNSEKVLSRCLDSIIRQNYTDFELLLIDDGSTDNSGAICDEYARKDSRIRVFHKRNGGVSSARNVGLENAGGKWVTFCDSDDYVNPDWLDIYISLINVNDVDMACQGIHRIGLYASSSEYCTGIEYHGDNKGALNVLCQSLLLGYVWNKLLKRSIIEENKLRFDELITFKEDEEFVLRYMKCCKLISCVFSSGYNYDMPDLSIKYKSVDNYYTSLSTYQSVQYIYGNEFNEVCQEYINVLTNSFFSSYHFKANDIKKRLKLYRRAVGMDVFKVRGLSIVSKLIFLLPLNIADVLFLLKSKLSNA